MYNLYCLVLIFSIKIYLCEKIPMKIVDDPVNYEHGTVDSNMEMARIEINDWLSTVHPTNFSGPEQLKQLTNHCFSWTNFKYKYEFCPFHNVTQHEVSPTWNPYKGVLGVWGEWSIRDNKFSEMLFVQGDACEDGAGNRSVKVQFQCEDGILGRISEVSEPDRCRYHLTFMTQLVCHPHALLVYPRLSKQHQHTWDQLFSEHTRAEITDKGLELGLQQLFQNSGFYLNDEARSRLRTVAPKRVRVPPPLLPSSPCELQLERLRAELHIMQDELNKLRDSDNKIV